jgi:hypothetical protein
MEIEGLLVIDVDEQTIQSSTHCYSSASAE